jgi:hypothetical protein
MNNKTLTGLIAAAALTGTFSAMTPANAAVVAGGSAANPFVVTVEAPGVQQSQLLTNSNYGAKDVYVDNFNTAPTGNSSSLAFTGISTSGDVKNLGTFQDAYIHSADVYGGADGTGNYFDVDKARSGGVQSSTLTLTTPERYFGMWWSAGDSYNTLSFYNGDNLLQTFTTKDVVDFISGPPVQTGYNGNPNSNYKGQDSTEPFAYLNFFLNPNDPTATFNKIVFSNAGGTGFESDNFTVASQYSNISGTNITQKTPESSSVLGMIVTGFVGISSIITRRKNRNSEEVVG